VGHEHELDRARGETFAQAWLQLLACPLLLGFREPLDRQLDLDLSSLADEQVPDDERAVRLEEEYRLGPVRALDDDRIDAGRQLDLLLGRQSTAL
jgi:hypothetical protein